MGEWLHSFAKEHGDLVPTVQFIILVLHLVISAETIAHS